MGQIFNRIMNISSSYANFREETHSYSFENDDDELKRIIDNLDSEQKNNSNSYASYREKDNYDILGVSSKSTKDEIYSAYKNLLKQYHPDKVATLGKEIQEIARIKTMEINQAFQKIKDERQW